jgi:hypothetical protein
VKQKENTKQIRPLKQIQIGRKKIEAILRDSYKTNLEGFWRWLFDHGEINSPDPPEDWDPYVEQLDHTSKVHEDVPQYECKVCTVWTEATYCWRIAEMHESFVRKAAHSFLELLKKTESTLDECFRNGDPFIRASVHLHPPHEIRQSGGKTVHNFYLTEQKEPERLEGSEDVGVRFYSANDTRVLQRIIKLGNKVYASGSKLSEDIEALLGAIEEIFKLEGVFTLYSEDKDFLLSKVAFDLKRVGFKPLEIADMLNGKERLPRDKVGNRYILSEEGVLFNNKIVKRIQRLEKLSRKQNQDV